MRDGIKTMFNHFLLAVGMLFFGAVAASAQDRAIALSGDVKLVKLVTDENGEERRELVEPVTIVPGDRLMFGTDYQHKGAERATNFVVTNPLPKPVRLAPDADAGLTVSVDGGENWGQLAELEVAEADGTVRAARHADVTHVRWTLATVEPGEKGRLEYPAIIR